MGQRSPMDVTNCPPPPKTQTTKNRWRCDVCKVQFFDTFEEACEHESACQNHQPQQKEPAPAPVSKSSSSSCSSSSKSKEVKATAPVNPFFAPRKSAAAVKQQGKTQHTFFEPRNKNPKAKANVKDDVVEIVDVDDSSSSVDSSSDGEVQVVVPKKKRSAAAMTKKKSNKKKKENEEITSENADQVANALAAMINKSNNPSSSSSSSSSSSYSNKKQLAGIFSMPTKQVIAEQRQAEFQAKLRMQRQKEAERQQRRQANVPLIKKKKHHITGQTSSTSLLPLAPRFPVPSHVVNSTTARQQQEGNQDDETETVEVTVPPSWKTLETTGATDHQSSATDDSTSTKGAKLISSPSALDSCIEEDYSHSDLIQQAIADIILPPPPPSCTTTSNRKNNNPVVDSRLLVDKYGMDSLLIGEHTQQVAVKLQNWVQEWCQIRQTAMDRMMERQRKLQKKKKKKSNKKYNYKDDDDLFMDEEERMKSIYLITGPPGSGKSALVHYVAKQCDCAVLEINTTQARGGSSLKNAIQEATQSCSSLDLIKKHQEKQDALLDDLSDEEEEDDDDEDRRPSSSLTVILIDEVDFIYETEGDSGFWTALGAVAKTAKCPIFLTANCMPPSVPRSHEHVALQRPTPVECVPKILQTCRQEGMKFKGGFNRQAVESKLAFIAQVCQCDLRRVMNELQSFMHARRISTDQQQKVDMEDEVSKQDQVNAEAGNCMHSPVFQSIEPCQVPAIEYSVITVRGKNFNLFARACRKRSSGDECKAKIGQQICKMHILNDETLLVLCPPCHPDDGIVAQISIHLVPGQTWSLNRIERVELPGGGHLDSFQPLCVQYCFPKDAIQTNKSDDADDNDEECEFEGDLSPPVPKKEALLISNKEMENVEEKGKELWNKVLSESPSSAEAFTKTTSKHDYDLQAQLETLSSDLQYASDAALLEDMQQGIPYLSGACLGLGFELTGGNEGDQGKLKMNENSRPPREERLFDLGWKENCYFYGDADTYVTHPATAHERRLLRTMESTSRGKCCFEIATTNDSADDGDESTDLDELILQQVSLPTEDDRFLPQQVPSLLLSLPSLLRRAGSESWYKKNWTSNQLLDQRRENYLQETSSLVSTIDGLEEPPPELLPLLQDNLDARFYQEDLPILRRLAFLEQDAERLHDIENPIESRKRTRSSKTIQRRHHYFEFTPWKFHKENELGLTASQVGKKFAKKLLVYNRPSKGGT